MRLPAQPASSNSEIPRRPQGSSVAAPVKVPALHITMFAGLIAFAGVCGIAANRHWTGNTDWISLGWTAVAAIGALGFAGVLAQGVFKATKTNALANFTFALIMTLTSAAIVLCKGPAHNFAVTELSNRWPAGAELLAKTDSNGPQFGTANASPKSSVNTKAVKGEPAIRVYHKGDQNAAVQPKGD